MTGLPRVPRGPAPGKRTGRPRVADSERRSPIAVHVTPAERAALEAAAEALGEPLSVAVRTLALDAARKREQ